MQVTGLVLHMFKDLLTDYHIEIGQGMPPFEYVGRFEVHVREALGSSARSDVGQIDTRGLAEDTQYASEPTGATP